MTVAGAFANRDADDADTDGAARCDALSNFGSVAGFGLRIDHDEDSIAARSAPLNA